VRYGDVLEPDAVADAVAGCAMVFHVAGDYRLWAADQRDIYRNNVDGTRTVLDACVRARVERVVHTSSVATLGRPEDGGPRTETSAVDIRDMIGPYARSKFLAERVAQEFAARGLPVVIVNPSACFGPWDVKPTPTGQVVLDYLRGRMLASLDTGLNVVHVADVARGHLLAALRGRAGERYILAGENHSLSEVFDMLARITGIRAPRVRLPYPLMHLIGLASEGLANITKRSPRVPLSGIRMARTPMYVRADKAGAGARTGSDAGRSGAARRGSLVRRPRLRALATSLFADHERRRPALTSRSASAAIWPTDRWALPDRPAGRAGPPRAGAESRHR
jgi:dihydroflavonol-4-reductase